MLCILARSLLCEKSMIKKYLTLLPAIALLVFVKQACALSVTVDPFNSVLGSEASALQVRLPE